MQIQIVSVKREYLQTLISCWTWLIESKHGPNKKAVIGNNGKDYKIRNGVAKAVGCSQWAMSKIWCSYKKRKDYLYKKNTWLDQGRHWSVRIENQSNMP